MAYTKFPQTRGFTLIELLIAIAIIGALCAIAIPSYRSSARSAQRAAAAAALVDCSQKMERHYAQDMAYKGASIGYGANTCVLPKSFASSYAASFVDAKGASAGSVAETDSYVLLATPTKGQSADPCQALCIDSSGAKLAGAPSGAGTTCAEIIPAAVAASCW